MHERLGSIPRFHMHPHVIPFAVVRLCLIQHLPCVPFEKLPVDLTGYVILMVGISGCRQQNGGVTDCNRFSRVNGIGMRGIPLPENTLNQGVLLEAGLLVKISVTVFAASADQNLNLGGIFRFHPSNDIAFPRKDFLKSVVTIDRHENKGTEITVGQHGI